MKVGSSGGSRVRSGYSIFNEREAFYVLKQSNEEHDLPIAPFGSTGDRDRRGGKRCPNHPWHEAGDVQVVYLES